MGGEAQLDIGVGRLQSARNHLVISDLAENFAIVLTA
jgi:hypothetical protein